MIHLLKWCSASFSLGRVSRKTFLLTVLMLLLATPTFVHGAASVVDLDVPDLELTDQNGQSGKFVSDFIGERTVALTFTYTSCGTICPVLDGIFKDLQSKIAADLGHGVALITVSIDPVNDIPPRLKAHAEKIGAGPGWSFLTGEKETVSRLLKSLEVYSPDIFNHPPTVFVVDGRRGLWNRLNGFPSPKLLERTLNEYRRVGDDS